MSKRKQGTLEKFSEFANERQAALDAAPEFEKLIMDMQLENELEYMLNNQGHECNSNIAEKYRHERPEVRMRRSTFKVIDGGKKDE